MYPRLPAYFPPNKYLLMVFFLPLERRANEATR